MVVTVKQTWWHIEEIYYPSYARVFRQVMDIITDENQISISRDDSIVGLKAWARNSSNREIPFIDVGEGKSREMLFILSPLNSFPEVDEKMVEKYDNFLPCSRDFKDTPRHIKLELEYISIEPQIKSYYGTSKFTFICPKKTSTVSIKGRFQPELYITVPLGWRMGGAKFSHKILPKKTDKKGIIHKISNVFSPNEIRKEGDVVGMKYTTRNDGKSSKDTSVLSISTNEDITEDNEIEFNDPFIKLNNGKRTYNYLVESESYNKIKDVPEDTIFKFTYMSELSLVVVLLSLVPFILFLPVALFSIGKVVYDFDNVLYPATILPESLGFFFDKVFTAFAFKIEHAIMLSILAFSFFGVEYSLIREGFNIPHKYYHLVVFIALIAAIVLIFGENCALPLFCNSTLSVP